MKRLEHEPDMPAANGGATIFVELGQIGAGDENPAGAG